MSCEDCEAARANPDYRTYSMGCLHCGARYFQSLKTWPPAREMPDGSRETREQRQQWRTQVVVDWVAWGHDRDKLMELAGADRVPYAPVEGRGKKK